MWDDIYGSYAEALILNTRSVLLLCADPQSYIDVSEFLTLKQLTSHGLYSKALSLVPA